MLFSPYITLVLWWIIFAVVHTGLASNVVTRGVGTKLGKYHRPLYSLIVLIVLLILIHYHFVAMESLLWHPHWFFKIIAALLLIGGLAVIVISLWKHLLAYSGIAALLGIETAKGFEEKGLHKYVRHPLYTGVLFFVWGVFIGYPYENNLISAVCFTVYAWVAIYFLEKKLVVAFGDSYSRYKMKVPRLLPF